nr:hypothetical protein [uncultured Treponema sp.]
MISKSTRGSEWRKWDLHLHTPSSYDYKDKTVTNADIINKLYEMNVSAVAITDHHLIDIERINELTVLGKDKNITIFPGIEILSDARGSEPIHIIGIFSNESKIDFIWSQLKARTNICQIEGKGKNINEVYCDLADTVELIHELGGIVTIHAGHKSNSMETIPHTIPHGDAQKNDIAGIVDIFEVAKEKDVTDYNKFVNPSIFKSIGKKLPVIICSDNHDIKNYNLRQNCWIKADLTFNGLKQIIYEPETRVLVQEEKPEHKNDYQIIDSITFDNEEMGSQIIKFNPNLNTIIGGRSSGKSILLGCIATSIDPKRKAKKETSYNSKYNAMVDNLKKKATVTWCDKTTKSRKIIYYSQSEISEIVRPDEYGISGINDLVQNIIKRDQEKFLKIQNYEAALISNRTEINSKINDFCELKKQIDEKLQEIANIGNKSGIVAEITKIQNEIDFIKKSIEGYLSEEEDKKYKKQKEQVVKFGQANQYLNSDINQFSLAKEIDIFTSIDSLLSSFSQEQKESLSTFYEELKKETKVKWILFLENKITELRNKQNEYKEKLIEITNSELFKKGEYFQDNNTQLTNKDKAINEEKQKKYEIEKLEQEIKELNKAKDEILSNIYELFNKYSKLAYDLAENLVLEKSEVKITANVAFLYKDFFETTIELLNRKEKAVKKYEDYESKEDTERFSMMKEVFNGITSGKLPLKKNENIHQTLINLFANNYFKISYDVTFDGDSFTTMSEGKKAFIVLRLLLDFDDSLCPIMIDQPEDDLDNRAIYDKLVEYLRKQKSKRQIILATHNPNVVVGADSELVIVANQNGLDSKNQDSLKFEYYGNSLEDSFEDKSSQTILLSKGIREHVCEILEGGNLAFEIREKKYGYKAL